MENKYIYKNLGDGRKTYLCLQWIGLLLFSFFWLKGIFNNFFTKGEVSYIALCIWLFFILINSWLHYAIVKRKTKHLALLALLHLIPIVSFVHAIILYFIYKVSKAEKNDPTQIKITEKKPIKIDEDEDPWTS